MSRIAWVIFSLLPIGVWAQCPSQGLDDGSWAGWDRSIGLRTLGTTIDAISTPNAYPTGGSGSRFVFNSDTSLYDPYTGGELPLVPPGGNYSIRLGDQNDGAAAERLKKSFLVSNENALFTLYFAAVSERPNHPEDRQPIFGARLLDQNDSTIFCTDVRYIPNFTNYPTKNYNYDNGTSNPTKIEWADWQVITLDLRPYLGQIVTVEVANGDCGLSQHFSYGYFSIECNPARFEYDWCMKEDPLTLVAPPGFEEYIWNNGVLSDTSEFFGMDEGDSVVCQLISNNGCESKLAEALSGSDVFAQFSAQFDTGLIAAVFNNTSYAYQANLDSVWWDFGDGSSSSELNPIHTYDSFGIFQVTLYARNDSGCLDSTSRVFTYYPPSYPNFSLQDTCGLTARFIDKSLPPVAGEITGYRWSFGDGGFSNLPSPSHTYSKGGSYAVRLITISNGVRRDTFSDVVRVYPFPVPNFITEPACINDPTRFVDASTIRSGRIVQYDWRFGTLIKGDSEEEWISFPDPGLVDVQLTLTSDANCVATLTRSVEVYPKTVKADFTFQPERIEVLKPMVQYEDASINAERWIWTENEEAFSYTQNPSVTYPMDTARYTITLEVFNEYECRDDTTQYVTIEPIYAVYIPSAYSPNGDALNEDYRVSGEGVREFVMIVRDRWGMEVARVNAMNQPVDLMEYVDEPQTVFSYEAFIIDKFGREEQRLGTITVVR